MTTVNVDIIGAQGQKIGLVNDPKVGCDVALCYIY